MVTSKSGTGRRINDIFIEGIESELVLSRIIGLLTLESVTPIK
jgi:hypothetical protein